jgi:hypothetical protein
VLIVRGSEVQYGIHVPGVVSVDEILSCFILSGEAGEETYLGLLLATLWC